MMYAWEEFSKVVPGERLELPTYELQVRRSTNLS